MTTAYTIVVTGGRPGLGRTQVAANLAIALQQQGRCTALLDLDIGQNNLKPVIGVAPPRSLAETFGGRARIEDLIMEGPGGIAVLQGGPNVEQMPAFGPVGAGHFISELMRLEQMFDFLVLDAGIGSSLSTLTFVRSSRETLVITTPDPFELSESYSVLKMISRLNQATVASLCVNFAKELTDQASAERLANVARALLRTELTVAGVLREDDAVRHAEAACRPVLLTYPTSGFAKDIRNLASVWIRKRVETGVGLAARLAEELARPVFNAR